MRASSSSNTMASARTSCSVSVSKGRIEFRGSSFKQPEDRDRVQRGLGNERRHLHIFRLFGTVRAAFGAMIVVAPRTETIQCGHDIPKQISIAQTAAFFDVHRDAEFSPCLLPDRGESVGGGITRPGAAFAENFNFHITRVAVHRTSHLA